MERSDRSIHPSGGEMMTKQSMSAETDINQIVARHIAHEMPLFVDGRATYGDFTGIGDYHGALNAVIRAEEEFMKLPAAVRDHCENDPGKFLELVYDPSRRAELESLGLVEAAVPQAAVLEAPVVPPVPPAAPKAPAPGGG